MEKHMEASVYMVSGLLWRLVSYAGNRSTVDRGITQGECKYPCPTPSEEPANWVAAKVKPVKCRNHINYYIP